VLVVVPLIMKVIFSLLLFALPLFAQNIPGFSLPGMSEQEDHTSVRLVSESAVFVPGEEVVLGIELTMDPHWHTYWINPGDSGLPTSVEWELPEGFQAGDIQWPTPIRFMFAGLVSYGYEGVVTLRVPIQTSEEVALGDSVTINGTVSWLECKDVCLPGEGDVSISLTASETPGAKKTFLGPSLPAEAKGTATFQSTDSGVDLHIPSVLDIFGNPTAFHPTEEGVWELDPAPTVEKEEDSVRVSLTLAENRSLPEKISGVLVFESGDSIQINAAQSEQVLPPVNEATEAERGTLYYMVFAFLAGIGMNLLPCIFPVLGLKISGFIEQAQGDPKAVKNHALIFAAGVVISLWVLAAVVGVLGAAWGAQFQDPRVVIGMSLILTFFSLNLFGVFELGNSLTTVGGDLTNKQGYGGSFFQGVLLTVIGTPCTGPILAVVIVWMLTQPVLIGFLAFTLMGLGMAAPYVALAYSPKLIEKLPRPGTWMVTFKKASAFMIVLFIWVMIYVLKGLIPAEGVVRVIGALLMVCFAGWVLGTWAAPGRSAKSVLAAKVCTVLLLLLSGWIAYSYTAPVQEVTDALQERIDAGDPIRWTDVSEKVASSLIAEGVPVHYRPYSPELVEELRAEGQAVFVDFTADWCTICKINKVRALHRDEVMKAFAEKGVVTLRADWTGRDPEIAAVLEDYGRRGVPVYQLFDDTPGDRAVLLPESLTPDVVFEALELL